jgi:hypothetical protein
MSNCGSFVYLKNHRLQIRTTLKSRTGQIDQLINYNQATTLKIQLTEGNFLNKCIPEVDHYIHTNINKDSNSLSKHNSHAHLGDFNCLSGTEGNLNNNQTNPKIKLTCITYHFQEIQDTYSSRKDDATIKLTRLAA